MSTITAGEIGRVQWEISQVTPLVHQLSLSLQQARSEVLAQVQRMTAEGVRPTGEQISLMFAWDMESTPWTTDDVRLCNSKLFELAVQQSLANEGRDTSFKWSAAETRQRLTIAYGSKLAETAETLSAMQRRDRVSPCIVPADDVSRTQQSAEDTEARILAEWTAPLQVKLNSLATVDQQLARARNDLDIKHHVLHGLLTSDVAPIPRTAPAATTEREDLDSVDPATQALDKLYSDINITGQAAAKAFKAIDELLWARRSLYTDVKLTLQLASEFRLSLPCDVVELAGSWLPELANQVVINEDPPEHMSENEGKQDGPSMTNPKLRNDTYACLANWNQGGSSTCRPQGSVVGSREATLGETLQRQLSKLADQDKEVEDAEAACSQWQKSYVTLVASKSRRERAARDRAEERAARGNLRSAAVESSEGARR